MLRSLNFLLMLLLVLLLTPVDGLAQCDPPLNPLDDGSGAFGALGLPPVVISEINPGNYIELYNTTESAFNTTGYWLCSPFDYAAVSVLIPAGSYKTIPWPVSFSDTDAGGEVILYRSSFFATSTDIVSFVCWGVNPHFSRKAQAQAVGKWIGSPCAGPLVNGAIHRNVGTEGNAPEDFDPTLAPSPMDCTPTGTGTPPPLVAKLSSYPNPFSTHTQIDVSLNTAESVALTVYSVDGKRVRSLGSLKLPAGNSQVIWDGKDDAGRDAASGVYLIRLTGPANAVTRVALLR